MRQKIEELLPTNIVDENRFILIDLLHNVLSDAESYDENNWHKYIGLLCQEDFVYCDYDPESYKTTSVIEKIYLEINEKFNDIPGSYMLDDIQKKQYIDKLFSAAFLKYISETQPQLLTKESPIKDESIEVEINQAIDFVAETYDIPDEYLKNIKESEESVSWGSWFTGRYKQLTPIEQLIKKYQARCNSIIGFDSLSLKERNKFLNKFIVLQERIHRNSRLFTMSSLKQEESLWNSEVEKAINKKFISQEVLQDLNQLANDIEADLIENSELCSYLKKQLLNATLEKIKNEKYNTTEPVNNDRITAVCLKIIIAKYLSNIYSFNQMSNSEQIDKIDSLLEIIQKERSSYHPSANHDNFNSEVSRVIDELMSKDSDKCKLAIESLNLKTSESTGRFNNILNTIGLFFRTPSVKAAIKGAVTAVLAANASPLMSSAAPINSLLELTGHNTNQLHSISPATSVSAAGAGMILGYKYHNKVNNIFPIEYLITEIADIYNNNEKKSAIDRLIRSVPIVTIFGAGLVGIATVLTTNTVSIPLLSSIALGGLVSVPVIAVCSKLANKVSQKVHNLCYGGVTNPGYYKFTDAGKFLLGNNDDNINKVEKFFETHIELLKKALEDLKSNATSTNEMDVVRLDDIINIIKKAFDALKNGENTVDGFKYFDDAIIYIIAYQGHLAADKLKTIPTGEIVGNITKLLGITDIYESLGLIKLEPTVQARLKDIKITNEEIIKTLETHIENIVCIYKIVQPTRVTGSSNLLDLQTLNSNQPTSIAATSSSSTELALATNSPITFSSRDDRSRIGRSVNRSEDIPKRRRSCI